MGMDQAVTFADAIPSLNTVQELLAGRGYPVQIRMIDGELAFPDEAPPATWRELRVGTAQGMVTLRREPGRVLVVTWGNADAGMRQAWHVLTWAVAEAGGGRVVAGDGSLTAAEFQASAELPEALRR